MAWIRGAAGSAVFVVVAGGGGLPGLAPSDQQVLALGPARSSSVDSVLPGRRWPWWRCFLPAARPSQFLCLLENIRSAFHRGSVADHGLTGALSTSSLTWLTLHTLSQSVSQSDHNLLCRHFVSSKDVRLRTLRLPLHRLHWKSLVQRLPVQSGRPLHLLGGPLPVLLPLLWWTVCSHPTSELITRLSSKYILPRNAQPGCPG